MDTPAHDCNIGIDEEEVPRDGSQQSQTTSMSSIIPFLDIATILERVSSTKTGPKKLETLTKLLNHFRTKFLELHGTLSSHSANGDSIFPLVRILCPSWDRERASYGIKDVMMGRLYAKVLGIDKTSKDGQKLFNYKDPKLAGAQLAGDVASLIYEALRKRLAGTDLSGGPTLQELHDILDQLARNKEELGEKLNQEKQIKILQGFIRRLSPLEGKWLAKIVLKKINLGVGETSVLSLVHPQAKELLATMSLEEVCRICNDPSCVTVSTGNVNLFSYFKPMLCLQLKLGKTSKDDNSKLSIISHVKKNPLTLPKAPFFVETKFDGERFQIHYEERSGSTPLVRYYSRKNHEYKQFNETLTPRLQSQINTSKVKSFVIDGEMMAYSYKNQNFTTKGENIDVKFLNPALHCPAFVAWDVLYINGESICEKPLCLRYDILRSILHPKETVCYISKTSECSSLEGVLELLDEAIENCEEGIVIKGRNSMYEPGQRNSSWLKLKPEYVDGCRVTDLDLVIVGGFYSDTRSSGGKITSLLLGILDGNGKDVLVLTKVGCGRLKHREMSSLVKSLEPYFVKNEIPNVKYKKRPDVFIDPRKSIVLEVNASEITTSKDYPLNYCLRFPIVSRVRRDKSWDQVMTVAEFTDLRLSLNKGKMVQKRSDGPSPSKIRREYFGPSVNLDSSSDDETVGTSTSRRKKPVGQLSNLDADDESADTSNPKRKIGKSKATVSPNKLLSITAATNALRLNPLSLKLPESNLFQGKVFTVIGSTTWKSEIEEKLKLHSGEIVSNPGRNTFAIVAENFTQTVRNKTSSGKWNVLRGTKWIDNCIMTRTLSKFCPADLFFWNEETGTRFADTYDSYGDTFFEDLSFEGLKTLLENVAKEHVIPELRKNKNVERIEEIRRQVHIETDEIDKRIQKYSFLSGIQIAFWPVDDFSLKAYVEFYGGKVTGVLETSSINYVIVTSEDIGTLRSAWDEITLPDGITLVKSEWMEACLAQKKLIPELPYVLNIEYLKKKS